MSINPISQRLPQFNLETPEGRQAAHRYNVSGIVDLNQAIAALKQQLEGKNTTASTGGGGGGVGQPGPPGPPGPPGSTLPGLGGVNNQLGVTFYATQASDNGAKIIVGDSSAITVSLTSALSTPYYFVIDNDSSAIASLVPTSGILHGESTVPGGGFGLVFFDGTDWWSGGIQLATYSKFGYVRPDGVTIRFDSTTGSLVSFGGGGSGITELTGDVVAGPGTGTQVATIQPNAITTLKILNNAVTYAKIQAMSDSSLLMGSSSSGTAVTEIHLGTNLSMSGTTLNADAAITPSGTNILISGGGVVWTGGLGFTVSAAAYSISGVLYSSPQTNLTLSAADPSLDRIDVIAVDNTGSVIVLTGTPAGSPLAPPVDPTTQLEITFVIVPAASAVPVVANVDVYLENTEWTTTATANINPTSTNNPYQGTKDIEATSAVAGNGLVLQKPSGTLDLSLYSTLSFYIRNKAAWPNPKSISIVFLSSGVVVGSAVAFRDGIYGFVQTNVIAYQQIVIPLSAFASGTTPINQVRFQVTGGGGSIGWYIDNIKIQSNTPGGGTGGTGTVTSVAMTVPSWASVSGSPITTLGVLGLTLPAFIASGASHAPGIVPDPGAVAGSTKFLREDSSWAIPPSGSGTVTTISVATANGFQGTVANPTTTPAISVNVDGTHYLPTTTDQTNWNAKQAAGNYITALTGPVTATGPGSAATTITANAITTAMIANANVTLAKIANAAASSKVLGSGASGSGSPYSELSIGPGLNITGTTLDTIGSVQTASILFGLDGGIAVPATAPLKTIVLNYGATIVGWSIIADTSGSASLDVCFVAGSAPPVAPIIPNTSTNKISASAPIVLSAAQTASGGASAISTWTTSLTQWGTILLNLTSITTCKWIQVQLFLVKT